MLLLSSGVRLIYSLHSIIQNYRYAIFYSRIQNYRYAVFHGLAYIAILAVIFIAFQDIEYTVSFRTIVELGDKWPPFLDSMNGLVLSLNMPILGLLFGIIVIYSKDEDTTYSGIHNPLLLQVINLSRLLLKIILIIFSFVIVLNWWSIPSISVVRIICLVFIFYIVLEWLANIFSIILRHFFEICINVITYIIYKFSEKFNEFIDFLCKTIDITIFMICIVIYTFFDVKKNGFIYHIYHNNKYFEKNLYGNLMALAILLYFSFITARLGLLMNDHYLYFNGFESLRGAWPNGWSEPHFPNRLTNLNMADYNRRTEDEAEPPMRTLFPRLGQQKTHTSLYWLSGVDKAWIFNHHLSPVDGKLFYLTDSNNRDFLFFRDDPRGYKISLIQKYSLYFCSVESVNVQVSGQMQTCYGLSLENANYSSGIYRGEKGVIIDSIFTNQDRVRGWDNIRFTSFGKQIFIPKGKTHGLYN